MASNDGNPTEVRLAMPEMEESDFIKYKRLKFKAALQEIEVEPQSQSQRAKPIIHRVPQKLRDEKVEFEKHFEPTYVALGPFHHGKPELEQAEQTKLLLAAMFAKKNDTSDEILFGKFMVEIKDLRECYNPEDIADYEDEKLAWMLFVDGCAVLCFCWTLFSPGQGYDRIWRQDYIKARFDIDLMLLENQLPCRVLKILIGSAKDPRMWELSIDKYITGKSVFQGMIVGDGDENVLDYDTLLHKFLTRLQKGKIEYSSASMISKMLFCRLNYRSDDRKIVTSVMDLKDSGIEVRPITKGDANLRNISFHLKILGILKMPTLCLDDSTVSLFMNLVALESCPDFISDSAVKSYIFFMASLIQTPEDVKELRVRGVLHNYLAANDEQVAHLFRTMSTDLVPYIFHYSILNFYIQNYCNKWFIRIYSDYFGANWSLIAFLGAITGLVLTLLQTYYTMNPKPDK